MKDWKWINGFGYGILIVLAFIVVCLNLITALIMFDTQAVTNVMYAERLALTACNNRKEESEKCKTLLLDVGLMGQAIVQAGDQHFSYCPRWFTAGAYECFEETR